MATGSVSETWGSEALLGQNLTIVALAGAGAVFYALTVALAFSHGSTRPFKPKDPSVYATFAATGAISAAVVTCLTRLN